MPEPLADSTDLAARLGIALTSAQTARADALLADASAIVRNYTRQTISRSISTIPLEPTAEQWLYLPERPVNEIVAVTVGGAALASGNWQLQNDALFRYDGWAGCYQIANGPVNQPDTIVVEYDHGFDTVPDDIVRIVCKIAAMSYLNPSGYRSASMGAASYTLASETIGTANLDDDDRRVLDAYRRRRRSVTLSAGLL